MQKHLRNFIAFVKDGTIISLAVGLVLGLAIKDVVGSIVNGLINPLITAILGNGTNFSDRVLTIKFAYNHVFALGWGAILDGFIHFLGVAAVIYVITVLLKVDHNEIKDMSKESAKG